MYHSRVVFLQLVTFYPILAVLYIFVFVFFLSLLSNLEKKKNSFFDEIHRQTSSTNFIQKNARMAAKVERRLPLPEEPDPTPPRLVKNGQLPY